jgi:hypothetical protein
MKTSKFKNKLTDYIEDIAFWLILIGHVIGVGINKSFGMAWAFFGVVAFVSIIPQIINLVLKYRYWVSLIQYSLAFITLMLILGLEFLFYFQYFFDSSYLGFSIPIVLMGALIIILIIHWAIVSFKRTVLVAGNKNDDAAGSENSINN